MLRRFGLLAGAVIVLVALVALPTARLGAQGSATPGVAAGNLAAGLPSGISLQTLASGQPDQLPASAPLILERLTFAPGASTGMRKTGGPELLSVQAGQVAAVDQLGLRSPLATGSQALLEGGAVYDVRDEGSGQATVLRLRLAAATTVAATGVAASQSGLATPGAASPAAPGTPATAAAPQTSMVAQGNISKLPSKPASIFLAQATYAPGSDTGVHTHTGPVGFVVESGTLSIGTSSGLTGQLPSGQTIVLPPNTPHHEANHSQQPVKALVFGVVSANQPLDVVVSHAIAAPTHAPVTLAPAASAPAGTASGTILPNHGSWQVQGAILTLDVKSWYPGVELTLTYVNTGQARTDFVVTPGLLEVYDDNGATWGASSGSPTERLILEPGQKKVYIFDYGVPSNADPNKYAANVFVAVSQFGEIHGAKWGFTYSAGAIIPLPPGVKDPKAGTTSAPASAVAGVGGVTNAAGSQPRTNPVDLAAMLPGQNDVPPGLVQTDDQQRSLDAVAQNYTNPADTVQRFTEWGWQGNVIRRFDLPAGAQPPPGGTTSVYVSIHRFGSAAGAAAALDYSAADQTTSTGVQEEAGGSLGDKSRVLSGRGNDGMEVTLYVQRGDVLVRVTAVSPDADPTPDAVAVAKAVLAK